MSRPGRFGVAVLGVALLFGCATKSLPPGTPPPEYEKRSFEPWPPLDAGADAAEPDAPSVSAPGETIPPDAGDAGDAGGAEPISEPPPPL